MPLQHVAATVPAPAPSSSSSSGEIKRIAEVEFPDMFHAEFCLSRARKLGLSAFRDGAQGSGDNALWRDLELLMYRQAQPGASDGSKSDSESEGGGESGGVDFTILFRELGTVAAEHRTLGPAEALAILEPSFYPGGTVDVRAWQEWLGRYLTRLGEDDAEVAAAPSQGFNRAEVMRRANPRYIMRNWMAIRAYEAAERGDVSVLHELHTLLQRPYENQGESADAKWYQKAPEYARAMPGALFLS